MDIHKKDLLFYSNFCEHSKYVVSVLIKRNIREHFILVCVDKKGLNIPPFVDRVPVIFTIRKELFKDEDVMRYIESKVQSSQTIQESIIPFSLGSATNSSQYTFLTEEGYDTDANIKTDMLQSHNFIPLGFEQSITSTGNGAFKEDDGSGKSSKIDPSAYERLMDARKMDDEMLKATMPSQMGGRI